MKIKQLFCTKAAALLLLLAACTPAVQKQSTAVVTQPETAATALVYVGTYAGPDSESIFLYRLDTGSGALTRVSAVKAGENPSYLTLDQQQRFLYAVNEVGEYKGRKGGAVSAFTVDPRTGELVFLNRQASSGGSLCHISLDKTGKTVLVASYGDGSVTAFPVLADGQLGNYTDTEQHEGTGPNKARQEGPHAHYIHPDPANRFAFAVDLGTDNIMGYRLQPEQARLTPNEPPVAFAAKPGAGPRHMVFHPNGRYAYVINELNSTMTTLAYDSCKGTFSEIQTSTTIPAGFTENNQCAAVKVSADGKFLYGSNRGHNSIVVFAIDENTGRLTLVEHEPTNGNWPRDFTLDLTGTVLLVANERSGNIVTYHIDKATGKLAPTGHEVEVSKPSCLQVVPDKQP
ncbi:lactonase family protein [Botryobacter ruber]|uniref:lactonase family protein n=1 Tax=Botryobacter ruber TaxID=2171629 RepID=UPI0013E313D5|nr:lactonase family protein [Botryobacter ruber]